MESGAPAREHDGAFEKGERLAMTAGNSMKRAWLVGVACGLLWCAGVMGQEPSPRPSPTGRGSGEPSPRPSPAGRGSEAFTPAERERIDANALWGPREKTNLTRSEEHTSELQSQS